MTAGRFSGERGEVALRFSGSELWDLGVAWVALGLAFTLFIDRGVVFRLWPSPSAAVVMGFVAAFARSLLTVGVGFLVHELAHKVVAVRFNQVAEFKADYGMLGLAIASGLAGFLFAAPGAVYHQGRITERENGLIALAGPIVNLVLAGLFLPLTLVPGFVGEVGSLGVLINVLLAGFNMLPFGPLDGRKVLAWSRVVFVVVFVPSAGLAIAIFAL